MDGEGEWGHPVKVGMPWAAGADTGGAGALDCPVFWWLPRGSRASHLCCGGRKGGLEAAVPLIVQLLIPPAWERERGDSVPGQGMGTSEALSGTDQWRFCAVAVSQPMRFIRGIVIAD